MGTISIAESPIPVTAIQIGTPDLGDHSYVIVVGDQAVAIDPQRDTERMATAIGDANLRAVFETHIHNDYVTGGHLLAADHGAEYLLPADSGATLPHREIRDGERYEIGSEWSLRAIHTPGHTPNHTSYELVGPGGSVAVFSGGSMLVGAVGRSDLLGPEWTEKLAHQQFHSVRYLAAKLPGPALVAPTHGAGSFCSASDVADTTSTIDLEELRNPALVQDDEDTFVRTQIAGYRLHPTYYAHMGPTNLSGVAAVDDSPFAELSPAEVETSDAEVIDLRRVQEWAAGHVPGSLSVPARSDFAQYVGWVLPWNQELILVGGDEAVAKARMWLARIGHDAIAGKVTDGLTEWRDSGRPLATTEVVGFDAMETHMPGVLVDVRDPLEYEEAHLPGAVSLHVSRVAEDPDLIPGDENDEVWLYCASGYRASVAAGFVERAGRRPVVVSDNYDTNGRPLAAMMLTRTG